MVPLKLSMMIKKLLLKSLATTALAVAFIASVGLFLSRYPLTTVSPRDLFIGFVGLCTVAIVPTLALAAIILWRYWNHELPATQAKPTARRFQWEPAVVLESLWWGVPTAAAAILGIIIWQSSHLSSPVIAPDARTSPLRAQVISSP